MHLVCDFDYTLFDTNVLWSEWLEILVGLGVDRAHALQEMERLSAIGWTHRAHALACGIPESNADALIQDFLSHARQIGPNLVYEDVVPFFDQHKTQHTFSILTFGDEAYQTAKVLSTGLKDYFDTIRIAGLDNLKVTQLRQLLETASAPIAFVDDSPNELGPVVDAGLPIKLYRIVRPGAKHDYTHEGDDVNWKRIGSMGEIEM